VISYFGWPVETNTVFLLIKGFCVLVSNFQYSWWRLFGC